MSERTHLGAPRRFSLLAGAMVVAVSMAQMTTADEDRPLTVFAAASLADVLEAWAGAGEELVGEDAPELRFNFAASSVLAEQLLSGASADLFVSADRVQIDRLIAAGKVEARAVAGGAANHLVVATLHSAETAKLESAEGLLAFDAIAMADPEAVPGGVYARTWLENVGLWERLSGRVIPTADVRAALAAVRTGTVPVAIVYGSDVTQQDDFSVLHRAAPPSAPEIRYWMAPLESEDPHPALVTTLEHLTGPETTGFFAHYGFSAIGAPAAEPPAIAARRGGVGRIVGFTLAAAAGSTLLISIPGIALAWALSRRSWRGRTLVEALVALPLVLPPTAVGFALLALLAPAGPVGGALRRLFGLEIVFAWPAVVLAAAVVSFPLLVRSARSAFEEVDPRLSAVARTLGRGPVSAFFAVDLPLAWRGVAAGAVLAFARALGEFGATVLVAGNIPGVTQTLALALFQRVQVGRHGEAWVLAGLAAALALAAVALSEWLVHRREQRLDG